MFGNSINYELRIKKQHCHCTKRAAIPDYEHAFIQNSN